MPKFEKGNQFWKQRSTHGRKPIFKDAEQLESACFEYFEWIERNPLQAAELVKFQGKAKVKTVPKMRAMTESGLCIFLDIATTTWYQYKDNVDYKEVTTRVCEIIYNHKFAGAAADMLNANIIARDLGLSDKQEIQQAVSITKIEKTVIDPKA